MRNVMQTRMLNSHKLGEWMYAQLRPNAHAICDLCFATVEKLTTNEAFEKTQFIRIQTRWPPVKQNNASTLLKDIFSSDDRTV